MSVVSEIMNKNVVSVHPEDRLEDVVKILTENRISGLPVVDKNNKVVGIITDRDILIYSEDIVSLPFVPVSVWSFPYALPIDSVEFNRDAERFNKTQVKEIMSKRIHAVKEDAPWHDAVILMRKNAINRVPVVDEAGRLKGILTRTDLLNYIAEEKERQ